MATPSRHRQPKLFALAGPWAERFGKEFFRALPLAPGIYFFRDADGRLLYIGQSKCLRTRIASYRQVDPDRNPKRTLRLIRLTCRIEWELCADAVEALARESALLLKHRPPFNRAGVWAPPQCGLRLRVESGRIELDLTQAPGQSTTSPSEVIGPFPGHLRRAFGPLVRCLFRAMHPTADWWDYPAGLLTAKAGARVGWPLPAGYEGPLAQFRAILGAGELPAPWFTDEPDAEAKGSGHHAEFWAGQAEAIKSFRKANAKRPRAESSQDDT